MVTLPEEMELEVGDFNNLEYVSNVKIFCRIFYQTGNLLFRFPVDLK